MEADGEPSQDIADKAANSYTKEFLFSLSNSERDSSCSRWTAPSPGSRSASSGSAPSCEDDAEPQAARGRALGDPVPHLPGEAGAGSALSPPRPMSLSAAAATARRLVEPVLTVVFPSACSACGRLLAQPTPGPAVRAVLGRPAPPPGPRLPLRPARGRRGDPPAGAAGAAASPSRPGRAWARTRARCARVIHELKYRGRRVWPRAWPRRCSRTPRRGPWWPGSDVLVPVPLHPRRLRERGFNQSALLARELGRRTGRPCGDGVLVRRLDTSPQAGPLGGRAAAQRGRGLRGAAAGPRWPGAW